MVDPTPRSDALETLLAQCECGRISAEVALMEMLIEAPDARAITEFLVARRPPSPASARILERMAENASGCARIAAMVRSGVDSPPRNASVDEGVAFCKRLFDWSVQQSEEASVALYSLGNPELLAAATREIVGVLERWGTLGRDRRALDLGCGIGRMEEALSAKLGAITGIDVSEKMLAAAGRRCAGLDNVTLRLCGGRDLREWRDGEFDLVLAIDSFPYLVQSGMELAATHFAEAARVLRGGGEFIVLNFSYGDDAALERSRVASLCRASGFETLVNGESPFALWNGVAYRMRKTPRACPDPTVRNLLTPDS